MSTLVECLARLPDLPWGRVVHIGPTAEVPWATYRRHRPLQLLLVDGDPERVQPHVDDALPVDVRQTLVGPLSQSATWRQYNLPRVDGLARWDDLRALYPRLRETASQTVEVLALADAFQAWGLSAERTPGRLDILVIDLPRWSRTLLPAVEPSALLRFSHVVIRDCAWGYAERVCPPFESAIDRLFETLHWADITEPLWPSALLRIDPLAVTVDEHVRRIAVLEAELSHCREAAEQASSRHEDARVEFDGRLQAAAQDRDHLLGELAAARAAVAAMQSAADDLAAALNARGSTLEECESRAALLGSERDALQQQLEVELGRIGSLQEMLDRTRSEAREQVEALARARDALAQAEVSRQALSDRCDNLIAAQEALNLQVSEHRLQAADLGARLERTVQALDLANVARDELTARISDAVAARDDAMAQLDAVRSVAARLPEVEAARASAEAELAAASAQLQELHAMKARWLSETKGKQWLIDERDARIAELEQRHAETVREHAEARQQCLQLQQRVDALEAERQQATQRVAELMQQVNQTAALRDDAERQRRELAERSAQLQRELAANSTALETALRETADSRLRQNLLDEELVKAKAQIELIKDLLLRGPEL